MTPEEERVLKAAYIGYTTGLREIGIYKLVTTLCKTVLKKRAKEEEVLQYLLEISNKTENLLYNKFNYSPGAGRKQ